MHSDGGAASDKCSGSLDNIVPSDSGTEFDNSSRPPDLIHQPSQVIQEYDTIIARHSSAKYSSSKEVTIEITTSTPGRRIYDKIFACFYCGKIFCKMSEHLLSVHGDEKAVKDIESLPLGSRKRKDAFEKLRLKGNFVNNMKVLNVEKGKFLVYRYTVYI